MQRVMITGANGFVGSHLVKTLVRRNYEVLGTGKGSCRFQVENGRFDYSSMDFTDPVSIKQAFRAFRPEVVVHAGAVSKPDECEWKREEAYLQNVKGTANLLGEAAGYSSHFLFLSTDFVFSGEKGMYKEEDERSPVNYYGQTKLLAEDLLMEYKGPWSIARTVLVYGNPGKERGNIISSTAKSLLEGKPLKIFTDQVRTPTYVEDLAWGLFRMIETKASGIYHLSGKDVMTPYEMALSVARVLKLNDSLISPVVASDFEQPAARPAKTGFDISKSRRDLGFDPVSFDEGLRRTLTGMGLGKESWIGD